MDDPEPRFAVTWHIAWGHVKGEVFTTHSDAAAKFQSLKGGFYAAALWGPDCQELSYYGGRRNRDKEMQDWWTTRKAHPNLISPSSMVGTPRSCDGEGAADPLPCLVLGAGNRGRIYSQHPELQPVAVAEPREGRRHAFAERHDIPPERQFSSWQDAFAASGRLYSAEICIVATPDRDHVAPAVEACKLFRAILLEKPMAVTEEDCNCIVDAARANGTICAVCHVLRYTFANRKVRELIRAGVIGEVLSINHVEPVGYQHFAHSFVRGNWRLEEESTFSLLAKCCHDVDLIASWMGDDKPLRVNSFGSLQHFTREKKPPAAEGCGRCVDCPVQGSCPYSAPRLYLPGGVVSEGWAAPLVDGLPDLENVTHALRVGPYGRCAYECDNDVCDHQVVNVEFQSGAVATLMMVATTERLCERETKVYGSYGELCTTDPCRVRQVDFRSGHVTLHEEEQGKVGKVVLGGHGGADQLLVDAFVKAVRASDASLVLTSPEESLRTHRLAFLAEHARRSRQVVEV